MYLLKTCLLMGLLVQPLHADDNFFYGLCAGAIGLIGLGAGAVWHNQHSEKTDLKAAHKLVLQLTQKYAHEIQLLSQVNPADPLAFLQQSLRNNNATPEQFMRMLEQDIKTTQAIIASVIGRIAQWQGQPNKQEYVRIAQESHKALTFIYSYLSKLESMSKYEKPYLLLDEHLKILEPRYAAVKINYNSYGASAHHFIKNIQAVGAPSNFALIEGIRILKRDIESLNHKLANVGQQATASQSQKAIKQQAFQLSSAMNYAYDAVIQTGAYRDEARLEEQAKINEKNAQINLHMAKAREYERKKDFEAEQAQRIHYENVQRELHNTKLKLENDRLGIPQYKATISELRQQTHELKAQVRERDGVISSLKNEVIIYKRKIHQALKNIKLIKDEAEFPSYDRNNPGAFWSKLYKMAHDVENDLK